MNERAYVVVAVIAAAVLALILAIYFLSGDGTQTAADASEAGEEADESWDDDWLIGDTDDDFEPRAEATSGRDEPGAPETQGSRRGGGMRGWGRRADGGADDPGRRARRRANFLSRIELVALGPEPHATTSEDILEAFGEVRPVVRDCLRASGIDRGGFRSMRATERSLTFDLDPDGAVLPDSVVLTPPPPEPLAGCLISGLEVLAASPPGGEGVRVSIDFPARRRRVSDGGVR